jgi:hypothetical protein
MNCNPHCERGRVLLEDRGWWRYGGWVLRVWGVSVALPGTTAARLASGTLLLELNLVGHALRVGRASVALLRAATAPQLVLDLTPNPNGHGPRPESTFLPTIS